MKSTELKKARRSIDTIAERENASADDIRREMREAISEGMNNHDPAVKAAWKDIPCKGDVPEPEELIAWLAEQVKEKLKK